ELGVRDDGATVPWPVVGDSGSVGSERLSGRGVADGMDVDLETGGVDGSNRLGQRLTLPDAQAAIVQRRAVRFEQCAGLVLDDSVGEELHGLRAQQRI